MNDNDEQPTPPVNPKKCNCCSALAAWECKHGMFYCDHDKRCLEDACSFTALVEPDDIRQAARTLRRWARDRQAGSSRWTTEEQNAVECAVRLEAALVIPEAKADNDNSPPQNALLPCPFCGYMPYRDPNYQAGGNIWCNTGGCPISFKGFSFCLWQRRPPVRTPPADNAQAVKQISGDWKTDGSDLIARGLTLEIIITVAEDGNVTTINRGAPCKDFEKMRRAYVSAAAELHTFIERGPTDCPFAPTPAPSAVAPSVVAGVEEKRWTVIAERATAQILTVKKADRIVEIVELACQSAVAIAASLELPEAHAVSGEQTSDILREALTLLNTIRYGEDLPSVKVNELTKLLLRAATNPLEEKEPSSALTHVLQNALNELLVRWMKRHAGYILIRYFSVADAIQECMSDLEAVLSSQGVSSPVTRVESPDTKRLDWLEQRASHGKVSTSPFGNGHSMHSTWVSAFGEHNTLRSAIDAAMASPVSSVEQKPEILENETPPTPTHFQPNATD